MEKLPIFELQTKEPIEESLPENVYNLIILVEINDLPLLKEINKDLKENNFNAFSVFIGDSIIKVTTWAKKEPKMMKIHWSPSIGDWSILGVSKTPWILVLRNMEVILSSSPTSLGKPLVSNLKKKIGIDSTSNSHSPTPMPDRVVGYPTIEYLSSKLEDMEQIASKNQDDIQRLKENLAEKDRVLKEILDKL